MKDPLNNLTIKHSLKSAAGVLGYDIHRRELAHPARRNAAMRLRGIDLVLDVGANTGQYVSWLRDAGYDGGIVSFEPIPSAYATLTTHNRRDTKWQGIEAAVGAAGGFAQLNVAESAVLSSLLQTEATLQHHIPGAKTQQTISVPVVSLDDVWEELVPPERTVMLKIDTQGFEHSVLDGAVDHLSMVDLVEVEMSLVPLYKNGSSIHNMLPRLLASGFDVISIESGFVDARSGQVLDVDVLAGRPVKL